MPSMLSDDILTATVQAYTEAGGNSAEAARKLGLSVSTYKDRLKVAVRKNMVGTAFGGETPPGYMLGKITQLHSSADGKRMEWRHLLPESETYQEWLSALTDRLNAAVSPLALIPAPPASDPHVLTVYPIPDVHLGQYSWGKEVANSYDLDIAVKTVLGSFGELVAEVPASDEALVLGLGDFFHADGNDARTPKSANALDVDGRYAKVQMTGAELLVQTIDLALQKHRKVEVRILAGNHDPRGGDAMTLALWLRYHDNPRVTINRSPALHYFRRWGHTMIAAHHGHETKPEQMPAVMAAYEPEMWGKSLYRYAYLGHIHKRSKGQTADERAGAIWETFQAITAKDAWNRGQGHASGRSIAAIRLHLTKGEVGRIYVPIAAN